MYWGKLTVTGERIDYGSVRLFNVQSADHGGVLRPSFLFKPATKVVVVFRKPGTVDVYIECDEATTYVAWPAWVPRKGLIYVGSVTTAPIWPDPLPLDLPTSDKLKVRMDFRGFFTVTGAAQFLANLAGNENAAFKEVLSSLGTLTAQFSARELIALPGTETTALQTLSRQEALTSLQKELGHDRPSVLEVIRRANQIAAQDERDVRINHILAQLNMEFFNGEATRIMQEQFTEAGYGIGEIRFAVQTVTPPPELAQAERERVAAVARREQAVDDRKSFEQTLAAFENAGLIQAAAFLGERYLQLKTGGAPKGKRNGGKEEE
jgi:regulator of protease activity HflC (stomatin/prohibitin superfamily)